MTDKRYQLTWRIRRLFKLMAELGDSYLKEHGITSKERAVVEHLSSWEQATVPDIARMFYVSRQNIQVRINKLMEKGWVTTLENPAHARSVLIRLTRDGKDRFAAIQAYEEDVIARLFADMDETDVQKADKVLRTLTDRILNTLQGNDSTVETNNDQRK